jgi:HAD superfamily hydrolase (TIGR01509 family)
LANGIQLSKSFFDFKLVIKALIFDVDGTLAETEELHRESFNRAFSQFGLKWHWDQETYGELLTTTGGKERMVRYAADMGLPPIDAAVVLDMHHTKNALYAASVASGALTLRPGVEQIIRAALAQNIKLGIATTTSRSNIEALISACVPKDLQNIFEVIVCGEDVTNKKPNPEVYNQCLLRLKIRASEAIAFEDSPVGLAAALAAGIPTIVTPSAYTINGSFVGALKVIADLQCSLESLIALTTV